MSAYEGMEVGYVMRTLQVSYEFSDHEPVDRAQDVSDMTGLGSFNKGTSKRVLDMLQTPLDGIIIKTQGVYGTENFSTVPGNKLTPN